MSRVLLAIAVSLVAHGAVVLFFSYSSKSQFVARRGVISVDFVEPFQHSGVKTKAAGGHRPKSVSNTPQPAASEPLQPGDPQAAARETDAYIHRLIQIIHQRKIYPRDALEREEEGRVVVGVTLNADGQVIEAKLEELSRFNRLNSAALKTISDIKSFPPLPPVIEAPLHLHIPLVYRLEDRR